VNNWTGVAVIVIGYAVGLYFQNKRIDDFKEGLYRFLDAKFATIEARLIAIGVRLSAIEARLTKLEIEAAR
jgi:hypothetical protein